MTQFSQISKFMITFKSLFCYTVFQMRSWFDFPERQYAHTVVKPTNSCIQSDACCCFL